MENQIYDTELFDKMWNRLVPVSGEAETVRGEVLRCAARMEYESWNNGNCNAYDRPHGPGDYYEEMRRFLKNYGIEDSEVNDDYIWRRTPSYAHDGYARLVAQAMEFVKQREEYYESKV